MAPSSSRRRHRPFLLLAVPAIIFIYIFFSGPPLFASRSRLVFEGDGEFEGQLDNGHRIRQATMLYEGDKDKLRSIYERSLQTHVRHGQRWGTPTHVLKRNLVEEASYFNKPAYLASLVMNEMAKPKGRRADWIVWFDGDTIIMNPEISWSVFLPPEDYSDIHILASQDDNGFNAGMLILRVHQWTVQALSEAVALHQLKPDVPIPFYDQSAIEYICSRPGYQEHFLYQPRKWWNRYFFDANGNEQGELIIHFAGIGSQGGGSSEKSNVMTKYLEMVEKSQHEWSRSLSQTTYKQEIDAFWALMRKGRDLLVKSKDWKEANGERGEKVKGIQEAEKALKLVMLKNSDKSEKMTEAIGKLEGLI